MARVDAEGADGAVDRGGGGGSVALERGALRGHLANQRLGLVTENIKKYFMFLKKLMNDSCDFIEALLTLRPYCPTDFLDNITPLKTPNE